MCALLLSNAPAQVREKESALELPDCAEQLQALDVKGTGRAEWRGLSGTSPCGEPFPATEQWVVPPAHHSALRLRFPCQEEVWSGEEATVRWGKTSTASPQESTCGCMEIPLSLGRCYGLEVPPLAGQTCGSASGSCLSCRQLGFRNNWHSWQRAVSFQRLIKYSTCKFKMSWWLPHYSLLPTDGPGKPGSLTSVQG